jgi:ABC-type uncharacterized transport system fused permease/ATPase subunit
MRQCRALKQENAEHIAARTAESAELTELRRLEADLSKQVQHLLKQQLDTALSRGGSSSRAAVVEQSSGPDEAIAEHLITFKDIMQLQDRNKQVSTAAVHKHKYTECLLCAQLCNAMLDALSVDKSPYSCQ